MAGLYYGSGDLITTHSDLRPMCVDYSNIYSATALYSPVYDHWILKFPWGSETLQDVSRERMRKIMWDEMDLRYGE